MDLGSRWSEHDGQRQSASPSDRNIHRYTHLPPLSTTYAGRLRWFGDLAARTVHGLRTIGQWAQLTNGASVSKQTNERNGNHNWFTMIILMLVIGSEQAVKILILTGKWVFSSVCLIAQLREVTFMNIAALATIND
jgi:hypothetical protein